MEDKNMIPEIDKEFETFDIEIFKEKNLGGEYVLRDDETLRKYTNYSNGYSSVIYNHSGPFHIIKNFFSSGSIEIKGVRFNNGSEYGIWYEFSPDGKLINEINTDEGYDYGWQDILEYCEENKITLTKGFPENGGVHTEIYKTENDNKKAWQITYYDYAKEQLLEVTLDGTTGEELQRRELEFIGG